jgi:SWIM zinc finger
VSGTEIVYRYDIASGLQAGAGQGELVLATSGGVTEAGPAVHPRFFSGLLTEPAVAAAGMLAVAAVARARYVTSASVVARLRDPVVTSNGDRLRFESFSGCCGVHARLDLLPAALDGAPALSGTTNVDFNDPMRAALAGTAAGGTLLLTVGAGAVSVTTAGGSVTERKVPLPRRWLKGLGEVQALAAGCSLAGELGAAEARRFIRAVPRQARRPLWVIPAGREFRLAVAPQPGAVCLAGPHRLAELHPLLRFSPRLRAYGPPVGAGSLPVPSAWELDLGTARLTLTLSPEHYRGFSGEGALLNLLGDDAAAADADLVSVLLAWDPRIDPGRLSRESHLPAERVTAALAYLAASGRVGYDLAEEAFFHRELPFGAAALESMHPRLGDARELAGAGAVTLSPGGAVVRSGDSLHRVTFADPHDRCTCPWWGKHQGTRGPCKHVLAARMATKPAASAAEPGDSVGAAR